jgi:RHS repeat-associated protein
LENGTSVVYAYDDANRMLSLDNLKGSTSFAHFDYGYDSVNRRKYVQRDGGKGDVNSYDAIDQVIEVQYEANNPDNTPGLPVRTVSYGLDAAGNRTTVTDNGTPTSYTTNNLNQYINVGANTLAYSTNGNLQSYNGWIYTYDAQNRLAEAIKGGTSVTFFYDSKNRCVKRIINGTAIFYYYDDWNLIQERDITDVLVNRYANGTTTDEIIKKVSTANTVYYHYDALGSVMRLTDNMGTVVEQFNYDVFGAATIKNAGGIVIPFSNYSNRFLFTGREFVSQIGLYDYRNRMYQQQLGRFLQIDFLRFESGDLNMYRYVLNNTINFSDPSGLVCGCECGVSPPKPGTTKPGPCTNGKTWDQWTQNGKTFCVQNWWGIIWNTCCSQYMCRAKITYKCVGSKWVYNSYLIDIDCTTNPLPPQPQPVIH